ncbi:MAG: hypothetical protein AAF770_03275 [Bacteroidota bacterium]
MFQMLIYFIKKVGCFLLLLQTIGLQTINIVGKFYTYKLQKTQKDRTGFVSKIRKSKLSINRSKNEKNKKVILSILRVVIVISFFIVIFTLYTLLYDEEKSDEEKPDILPGATNLKYDFNKFRYGGKKEKEWDDKIPKFPSTSITDINLNQFDTNPKFIATSILPEKSALHTRVKNHSSLDYDNSSSILISQINRLPDDMFPMLYDDNSYKKNELIDKFTYFHHKVDKELNNKIRDDRTRNRIKANLIKVIKNIESVQDLSILAIYLSELIPVYQQCYATAQDFLEKYKGVFDLDINHPLTLPGYIYHLLQNRKEVLVDLLIPKYIASLWLRDAQVKNKGDHYVLKRQVYKDFWKPKLKNYLTFKLEKKRAAELTIEQRKKYKLDNQQSTNHREELLKTIDREIKETIEQNKEDTENIIEAVFNSLPNKNGNIVLQEETMINNQINESWEEILTNTIIYHLNISSGGRHVVAGFKKGMNRLANSGSSRYFSIGIGKISSIIPDQESKFFQELPQFHTDNHFTRQVLDDDNQRSLNIKPRHLNSFGKIFKAEFTPQKVAQMVQEHLAGVFQVGEQDASKMHNLYMNWCGKKGWTSRPLLFDAKEASKGRYYIPNQKVIKKILVQIGIFVPKKKGIT